MNMKAVKLRCYFWSIMLMSGSVLAESFTLNSADIEHGSFMGKAQEFEGFGCSGGNQSPQLSWSGAPEGTKAFAITVYDPDAPTGSGWWHWQVVNIPSNVASLPSGAGNANNRFIPKGSRQISNDYGVTGFGGACPPPGDGAHRYQFTVHALSQTLDLPEDPSGALTGYMINAYSLDSATLEALYKR
ncbi:YbhB/YbcL family Raf kinase inhibitor-like protein [Marinomonas sp. THO17]|uniref:YbhB/YbcL family Raf kinase inhibitor-like protein n=1 Tax=Marinomonas sp. THO17 TaxID=3149048 RepID=UPI00336BB4F9